MGRTPTPLLGLLLSVSVIGVARNPWNRHFPAHAFWAAGVFLGGQLFAVAETAIALRRGGSALAPLCATTLGIASFWTMVWLLFKDGISAAGELFEVQMALMTSDFEAF